MEESQLIMNFTLKLVESNSAISQKIIDALLPQVRDFMVDSINKLKKELPPVIKSIVINTPEYESILNGKLKYEFGLPDSSSKLAGLLDLWSTNLSYSFKPPKKSKTQIVSNISVSAIKIDFSDVLYSDYAIMYDGLRGYALPWLEWLLLEGNKSIIRNYEVKFGSNRYSRTGNAIMKTSSASWSVPSEFAGTISDNWITRAIDGAENEINDLLDRIFI